MKNIAVQTLPCEARAHDFATKPGIDIDEKALTLKPFEWATPVGLGSLWKSNPLMKRPDHCAWPATPAER